VIRTTLQAAAGRRGGLIRTKERAMKILSIFAVVLSLLGAANVAMAQSVRDQGVVTGSQANQAEHETGAYRYGR
jgi:hypothetical protein